jgi:membrane-associated protein
MRYYLKLLSLPLLFLVLYSSLFIVWKIFNLPPAEELARVVKNWFDVYGLPVVFLSSILEGVLVFGSYFPGVFVIFIGVILAESVGEAIVVVITVSIGLLIAHIFNYALGRYGWYKLLVKFGMKSAVEKAQERLSKRGPIAIFLSYWLPSIGALTDTAAGIIHLPFRVFVTYSIISVLFWDTIVGVVVYILGDRALAIASPGATGSVVVYSIIAIWIVVLLVLDFHEKRKN